MSFAYGAITLYGVLSSILWLDMALVTPAGVQNRQAWAPRPPVHNASGLTCTRFGLCPFRSPLLGTSMFLSFPGATKMFQFTPLALDNYEFIVEWWGFDSHRVSAFGNLRIKGCLHLPEAYRS